mgnify:CR=1 FL=1
MKNQFNLPIPSLRALHKIGKDIKDARRRRRITIQLMAERAGISRATIGKIEKGDPTTSMGAYSAVLFVLGMTNRLSDLVDTVHDSIARQFEEENLPQRVRLPSLKKNGDDHE